MSNQEKLWKTIFSIVLIIIIISGFLFILSDDVDAAVRVRGYYRKDGTYVRPHYRSNPDGNPYNNWSFPGNLNPYTGEIAPGNPDTYLKNYYKDSSKSYFPSYVPSTYQPSYSFLNTRPSYHHTPPRWSYRLFRVPGTLTVWELSHWQPEGFGTRRAFSNPQSFERRYGWTGWAYIKPVSNSELIKYQEFSGY